MDNDIIILCLPPNTSHALQPLDVGVFKPVKVLWRKILNQWFTESRMTSVDKAVFPTLLNKLWQQLKPLNAINAFRGAGLYPPDRQAVTHRIVAAGSSQNSPPNDEGDKIFVQTPQKALRTAILDVLSPTASEETVTAKKQKLRKRKRVQAKVGEVLTEESVLQRLEKEAFERQKKKESSRPTTTKKVKIEKEKINSDSDSESISGNSNISGISKVSDISNCSVKQKTVNVEDLREGITHVIVIYEGSYFPGVIVKLEKREIIVSCMTKSGPNSWKWPQREDICAYELDEIIQVINPPKQLTNRGQYAVPEADKYWQM